MDREYYRGILGMSHVLNDTKKTMKECNDKLRHEAKDSIIRMNKLIESLMKEKK